jgi:amidase
MADFPTALDTAAAIRRREVSPLEVLEATLDRVDRHNPALNAVVWRNDDEAREEARRLGARLAAGVGELPPFAGVPIPIKDLSPVAGWPVTYGSRGAPEGPSTEDEVAVGRLRRAGFVLTGRTNTPEFGTLTVTENLRFGVTRNPWDLERTSGGSSGGASAALASGMFSVVHASDGGGSIRIPASCCGLVGLKPTRGRVASLVPSWQGMSTQGVLTHTVADAAALLDVLSVPDPDAWLHAPTPPWPFTDEPDSDPGPLRVAVNTVSALGLEVDAEAVAAVERTARLLEEAGHSVVVLDGDVFDPSAVEPFLNVVNAGVAEYDDIDWSAVEPHNRAGLAAAQAVDSVTFARSLQLLRRAARTLVARFREEFDLLLTPTMAIEPPRVGVLQHSHASPGFPPLEVLGMVAFCSVFNISGQPAVSLPVHQSTVTGLPVGVQLVAGPWEEGRLLRVAAQLERAAPWAGRHPDLG